jgi:hypothetical protein
MDTAMGLLREFARNRNNHLTAQQFIAVTLCNGLSAAFWARLSGDWGLVVFMTVCLTPLMWVGRPSRGTVIARVVAMFIAGFVATFLTSLGDGRPPASWFGY